MSLKLELIQTMQALLNFFVFEVELALEVQLSLLFLFKQLLSLFLANKLSLSDPLDVLVFFFFLLLSDAFFSIYYRLECLVLF